MNLFNLHSIYILVFLASSVLVVAQDSAIPLYTYPPNDGTKSYFVKGENGTNIFVDEKGDPKKTTILFSSGYLTSRIAWDSQWYDPKLYRNFHLVRYDYRGIGHSDRPTTQNSYSLDLNGADLSAVIINLTSNYDFSKKKIVLVGWSIGTPVTLTFLKNYPNIKVDGFVSVCGLVNSSFYDPNTPALGIFRAITDPQENYSSVINGFSGLFRGITYKQFSDEVQSMFLGSAAQTPLQYRRMALELFSFSLAGSYSNLTIPTLHFIGEKDMVVSMNHSLYFASLKQNSKSIIYKNIGHSPPWENTKQFNRDLIKFVIKV